MRRTPSSALLAVALLAACSEGPVTPPLDQATPPVAAAINDAVHNQGNEHFFFLPPMVPAPHPEGVFDGAQEPVVEICIWDGAECGPELELYNTEAGPGSETIRVDPEAEQYIVNWHTDDILANYPIDEARGESYRIRIRVGNQLLGYADVQVVAHGGEVKHVETGEFIPLLDGRTLPIKFRIEEGFEEEEVGGVVGSGERHVCAVRSDGDVYCWGENRYGSLGLGTTNPSDGVHAAPQRVQTEFQFASVSSGYYHSCALTAEGEAYCWGYNNAGQLGDGSTTARGVPVPVSGGHAFATISAGEFVTCGVTLGGEGLCWGYNGNGALGTGSITYDALTPTPVSGGHTFESISIQWSHACGLTVSGEGYCWGYDWGGQTAQGTTWMDGIRRRPDPSLVAGLTFQSLDAGWNHSCGVTTAGEGYCWGYNYYGQLGAGFRTTAWPASVPTPTPMAGSLPFVEISAGAYVSCALQVDGTAYCWGYGGYGGVGDGTTTPAVKDTPSAVAGGHQFTLVSAGQMGACGATTTGQVLCWGRNTNGLVGDGTLVDRSSPTQVLDLGPTTP